MKTPATFKTKAKDNIDKTPIKLTAKIIHNAHKGLGLNTPIADVKSFIDSLKIAA